MIVETWAIPTPSSRATQPDRFLGEIKPINLCKANIVISFARSLIKIRDYNYHD